MLRTDYKDDICQGQRRYRQIVNEDGTVSFSDVTNYEQIGDYIGAREINEIAKATNDLNNITPITFAEIDTLDDTVEVLPDYEGDISTEEIENILNS